MSQTHHDRKVVSITSIKIACKSCSLQQLCLPVGISMDDLEKIDRIIKRRRPITRHEDIFRPGDPFRSLYAIRSGSVKTYTISDDGREQIMGFHLPGEIVGLDAVSEDKHPCGAKALERTSLCEIPFDRLENLGTAIPSLNKQLLRIMSREIQADQELLMLLGKKSAEERLAALLLSLSTRFRLRGFSAQDIHLSMSRNDIGNYLGLAVETVSRLFSRFQQQKLLSVHNKNVRLEDLDKLRALAGVNSDTNCARGAQA